MVNTIKEINSLWRPIFPYLADFAESFLPSRGGRIAEIGPFCGVIYELSKRKLGEEFHILCFPPGVERIYRTEIFEEGIFNVGIVLTDPSFSGVRDGCFDFIFFRGAFFFPSIFHVDLLSLFRILNEKGVAVIGGGFGALTPSCILESIKERSKILNSKLGKIDIARETVWSAVKSAKLEGYATLIEEGGLWLILKK
ncbi:MAG: hypothetical protein N2513_08490 [Deltaproteobacteria bacterium]|nr:hypothetical protein [Deltaproteobacteria bacterium]